jgi:hypothetical protein
MAESTQPGHEMKDLNPRSIALFGAGLAVVMVLAVVASTWFFRYAAVRYTARQVPSSPLAHTREPVPEPRLQVYGAAELREMREVEDSVLSSYAWIDKEREIVRIPVDRAMEVLAKQEGGRQKQKDKQ